MSLPGLTAPLAALHQVIDNRLSLFKKFLKLSGRLDLVLSQIQLKSSTQNLQPSNVFDEGMNNKLILFMFS